MLARLFFERADALYLAFGNWELAASVRFPVPGYSTLVSAAFAAPTMSYPTQFGARTGQFSPRQQCFCKVRPCALYLALPYGGISPSTRSLINAGSSCPLAASDACSIGATENQKPVRTSGLSIDSDLKLRRNFRFRLKTPTGSVFQRLT